MAEKAPRARVVTTRLDPETHDALVRYAEERGWTLSTALARILGKYLTRKDTP